MSIIDGGSGSTGLIARVQGILLRPQEEWVRIDGEAATVQGLFTGYAMILAAIPAVATLIGSLIFVHMIPLALIGAVLTYALGLLGVFIFGYIVNLLAPSFGAQANLVQAMKLVVYSSTASWIGGILGIVPFIGWIGAIAGGLYSLYLLFIGTPVMMKSPADKSTAYTIVAILCAIVVQVIISMVIGGIIAAVTISMAGAAIATGAALVH